MTVFHINKPSFYQKMSKKRGRDAGREADEFLRNLPKKVKNDDSTLKSGGHENGAVTKVLKLFCSKAYMYQD